MSEKTFTGAAFYRLLDQHRLMAARCAACGALFLPPRPLCCNCHSTEMAWTELSGKGRLAAFTTVHIAPSAMIEAGYGRDKPYCTGIVQLEEGPSISAQILGVDAAQPDTIKIGMRLRAAYVEREVEDRKRTFLAFEKSG
jgi:uncharacterized OB-fold protein